MEPRKLNNTQVHAEEFLNERRPGLVGLKSFTSQKRVPRHQSIPLFSAEEKYSNSFIVPPVNKYLKNIAKEELKNDDNILAVLASLACAFALTENEETFARVPEEDSYTLYLRCGIAIFSIASIIWVLRRYQILLLLKVLDYKVGVTDTVITSGLYKQMIPEILIMCIISPIGFDYFFEFQTLGYKITYSLDDICTFFTLLRLYTLLRLFGHHSIYTQNTAETICERNGESACATFALKSFIQDSPFLGIGIVFFSLSLSVQFV